MARSGLDDDVDIPMSPYIFILSKNDVQKALANVRKPQK